MQISVAKIILKKGMVTIVLVKIAYMLRIFTIKAEYVTFPFFQISMAIRKRKAKAINTIKNTAIKIVKNNELDISSRI